MDPSPRVRRKKRKSADLIMMSPELSFVCDSASTDGEDDAYHYKLNKSTHAVAPKQSKTPVTYCEPLRDAPPTPSNKRSKMTRISSMSSLAHVEQNNSQVGAALQAFLLNQKHRMNASASAPSLHLLAQQMEQSRPALGSPYASTNPEKHLRKVLNQLGASNVQTCPTLDVKDFFHENTDDNINSYNPNIVAIVRRGDVAALREMHRDGRMLQSCNKFGESILHAACRRGAFEVVQFLLDEAQIELRLRDDYGRTPLHDACWTTEPETEIVQLLISKCPEMLLMTDKRGFSPLAYVRKAHWGEWCEFLDANRHLLKPLVL